MAGQRIAIIDFDGTTESIREFRRYDLSRGKVKRLKNGLRGARPVREGAKPPVDPATEALVGPSFQILATEIVESFSKRRLTPEEILERQPDSDHPAIQDGSGNVSRAEMNALKAYLRERVS